jgi:hypothetical protein
MSFYKDARCRRPITEPSATKVPTTRKYLQIILELNLTLFSNFVSELEIYVMDLQRKIRGRGEASTKKNAEAECALTVVRQLYHLGIMKKSNEPVNARKKNVQDLPPIPITVNSTYSALNIIIFRLMTQSCSVSPSTSRKWVSIWPTWIIQQQHRTLE